VWIDDDATQLSFHFTNVHITATNLTKYTVSVKERMHGLTNGRTDGWMVDGWMDEWVIECMNVTSVNLFFTQHGIDQTLVSDQNIRETSRRWCVMLLTTHALRAA
jgi:hypothetical protein